MSVSRVSAAAPAKTAAPSSGSAPSDSWSGEVPVIFTLAADEVTTYEAPPPYHMCLPRQSLLPFVLEPVREFFKPFAPPFGGEMWLEFQAVPLRWQMPTGVLFDLLVGDDAGDALPWALTVRFQGFPATKLLRASVEAAEAVLMNALKESCCLLCGSAQPAMTLSKDAQDGLRRAIATNDFEAFASVRRALAPSPHPPADTIASRWQIDALVWRGVAAQLGGDGGVRAVPLRVYSSQTSWRQLAPAPRLPTGDPCLLSHALAAALPAHFAGERASPPPSVLVQGVRVPLDTSLAWLARHCRHPDGFLYVSLAGTPSEPAQQGRPER